MNRTVGLQLVAYSLLLASLSYLVSHLAPGISRTTLITGLAGGGLCLGWAFRAIAGSRGKTLSIITLIAVSYSMLSQAIAAWTGGGQEPTGTRLAAAVITLLFVLSIGMMMRIVYAGVVLDGQAADPAKERAGQPSTTAKRSPSHAEKRA